MFFIILSQENTVLFVIELMLVSKVSYAIVRTWHFLPEKLHHNLWSAAAAPCHEMPGHFLSY